MKRFGVATMVAALLVTLAAATAAEAAGPAQKVVATQWGWVVARHPSTAHYTPAAVDRGNSTGGVNKITREAKGEYVVHLPGLAATGTALGTAFATAMGGQQHVCEMEEWDSGGTQETMDVRCYDLAGVLVDSQFTANYLQAAGSGGRLAYAWSDNDGPTLGTYTPNTYNNVDTLGGYVTVDHTSTGHYTAMFPGLATTGGTIQVSSSQEHGACQVAGWGVAGPDELAYLRCHSFGGSDQDSQFTVGFVDHTGFKGQGRKHQAYLYADSPTTVSYHPPAAYRFNTSGKASTVQHLGKGRYLVTLPGQPAGGSAEVSTYPSNASDLGHCQISSIRTSSTPAAIGVACSDFDGTPKNEQFVLAYTH